MTILKQVAGIDVAQKELVVSLGRMDQELTLEIFNYKVFPNNQKGFKALVDWAKKTVKNDLNIRYVMEFNTESFVKDAETITFPQQKLYLGTTLIDKNIYLVIQRILIHFVSDQSA